MGQTVAEIKKMLAGADEQNFADMQRALVADTRAGVASALKATRKRLEAQRAERVRVNEMYAFEQRLASDFLCASKRCAVDSGKACCDCDVAGGESAVGIHVVAGGENAAGIPVVAGGDTKGKNSHCTLDVITNIENGNPTGRTNISATGCRLILGLDEVGRGPLAGPLAIGAVMLGDSEHIDKLNDSKKLTAKVREEIAQVVRKQALVCNVVFVSADQIDEVGIGSALRRAFTWGITLSREQGFEPEAVLLDGNAMHLCDCEINVVHGDAKCASIAAASIVAKVERDALMRKLAQSFPEYKWDENKGYGSKAHIEAIKKYGLSPYHRKSFCRNFTQETLF